jgi:ABC-type sulfate transport system permease component
MPMKTEITPLLIITKLEQYDYARGATAIAVVMLVVSFVRAAPVHQPAPMVESIVTTVSSSCP